MSTRGARRWCPGCQGQVYFHHHDADGDVYYCQGCGLEVADRRTVQQLELGEPGPEKKKE